MANCRLWSSFLHFESWVLACTVSVYILRAHETIHWSLRCVLYPMIRDTRTCAILIPSWGWMWGLRVFPAIKIAVVGQVRVLPECTVVLSGKTSAKMLHGARRSWMHLFCIYFCVRGRQKLKDPQIESHSWQCHYTGWYLWCISVVIPLYHRYSSVVESCM